MSKYLGCLGATIFSGLTSSYMNEGRVFKIRICWKYERQNLAIAENLILFSWLQSLIHLLSITGNLFFTLCLFPSLQVKTGFLFPQFWCN